MSTNHIFSLSKASMHEESKDPETKREDAVDGVEDVVALTDLEPDDVLALYVALRLAAKRVRLRALVVGEGTDVTIKVRRARKYLAALEAEGLLSRAADVRVVAGLASKERFAGEGKEWGLSPQDAGHADEKGDGTLAELWDTFYATAKRPVLWLLKPPRELLLLLASLSSFPSSATDKDDTNKDEVARCKERWARTEVLLYGGFNLRCVLSRSQPRESRAALATLLAAFKRVVLYESFHATGDQNNLSPDNAPSFFARLKAAVAARPNGYLAALCRLVRQWNDSIAAGSLDTCLELLAQHVPDPPKNRDELAERLDKEGDCKGVSLDGWDRAASAQFRRNAKCALQVRQAADSQMVLADQALLALQYGSAYSRVCPTPVHWTLNDAGYTVYEPCAATATNTFAFAHSAFREIVVLLERAFSTA